MPDLVLEPMRRTFHDADTFSRKAHGSQQDRAGRPYWHHPLRVAERAAEIAIEAGVDHRACQQVALLHDVIEDTPYDADHLRREGFDEDVVTAVVWLTKTGNEPYADWIERLCADAPLVALIVKLADVEDNLDPDRLARLDEATQARLRQKYEPARERLRAAIEERGTTNGR